jgi:SH3-like domain-containing protein
MRAPALLLSIGVLLHPCAGMTQIPAPAPPPQPAPPPYKPTPVVHPRGPTHAQKPPHATATPAPTAPAVPPPAPPPPASPPAPSATPDAQAPTADATQPAAAPAKFPRFQSLRSNEVNLRSGPGTRYKIDWVYKRTDLPVKVEREFEHWLAIRDADGIEGWVNAATLNARRNFIVQNADATLRDDPDDKAEPVAILKPGVIGRIKLCKKDSDWCQVQIAGHSGYLRRSQFWGTLPNEEIPTP